MPATLDDLAADLQQFFAEHFPLDGADGPGSVLLVFDNLGQPLSAKEFNGASSGPAEDVVSHQRAADLADQLPAANALRKGWYMARGGSRLSRWYESVVRGADLPPSAPPAQRAAFEAAKSGALRTLDENQLAVVSGVLVSGGHGGVPAAGTTATFYATSMAPVGWYDGDSADWSTYQIGATDQPATAPATPARVVATPPFALLVADQLTDPEVIQYVQVATETEPDQPDPVEDNTRMLHVAPDNPGVLVSPGVVDQGFVDPGFVDPGFVDPGFVDSVVVDAPQFLRAAATFDSPSLAVEQVVFDGNGSSATVVNATVPRPVTSNGFAVSFEYCLVRLDRPWWDDVFLDRADWTLPGYPAGAISSGSATAPDGQVTLITIGMLVVRNLTITAQWTPADVAALPRSTSLGPFCIAGGNFDQSTGTLSRKGMQVIGWLCVVPPRLPPSG